MADIVSKAKRSEMMSRIKSRGNKRTEMAMVKLLRANKITGWRRHYPIEGKPDFAFPKQKVAIFVDGCFWHCCPKCFRMPKTNRKFWERKILANKRRDKTVATKLGESGWRVLRMWEHDLKRRPLYALRRVKTLLGLK